MRFRTLALSFMTALGLVGLASSAYLWSRNLTALQAIDEGRAVIELITPAVKFSETLLLERGVYSQVMVSRTLSFADSQRLLAAHNAVTDPLFAQALQSAQSLPGALRDEVAGQLAFAREIVLAARREAAPFLLEGAEVSPDAATQLVRHYREASEQIDRGLAAAERKLTGLDPTFATRIEIARLSNELREKAGYRSLQLSRYMASGKAFTVQESVDAAKAEGAVQIAWLRLQRLADEVGGVETRAGVERIRTEFLQRAEPVYQAMTDAAREGQAPPMDFLVWRQWSLGRLAETSAARDPPINEIRARLAEMRGEEIRVCLWGLAAMAGLMAALVAAVVVIDRRVLRPIGALTRALDTFAEGADGLLSAQAVELASHFVKRSDEIGSLARAAQRLSNHAGDLREANSRFDTLIDNLPHGVSYYDADDRLVVANRRFGELYGFPDIEALIGMSLSSIALCREINVGVGASSAELRLRAVLDAREKIGVANYRIELPNGRIIAGDGLRTPAGGWLSTHLDITERSRAEAQIAFHADHDPLTRLGNRTLLARELDKAIERARRGHPCAVLFLDLDRFKLVNDLLGHTLGDQLLRAVADRLRETLRAGDTIARLGGDEFVALIADSTGVALADVAARIVEALSAPYDFDGQRADVSVSIGIAVAPNDGDNTRDLLRVADLAMYRAKSDGGQGFRFFEAEMDSQMQIRRALKHDMRSAVTDGQFELLFQPIVNVERRNIVAFEALLRWNHPTRGRISPTDFIPLAEDNNMIVEIGRWVLNCACREAARWPSDIKVSVNLSPRQFNSGRLFADVVAALAQAHLPPDRLELEITEMALLSNTEATQAILNQLRALGVEIVMDDFGAGYSSLSYLRWCRPGCGGNRLA